MCVVTEKRGLAVDTLLYSYCCTGVNGAEHTITDQFGDVRVHSDSDDGKGSLHLGD